MEEQSKFTKWLGKKDYKNVVVLGALAVGFIIGRIYQALI